MNTADHLRAATVAIVKAAQAWDDERNTASATLALVRDAQRALSEAESRLLAHIGD